YNTTQKIIVNLLNENNLKEIYGDRYSLVVYQNVYAIKDSVKKHNLNFTVSDYPDSQKLAQEYSDTINLVTEILTDDSAAFRIRYLDFNKNSKPIDKQLSVTELEPYKEFIESDDGNVYKN